MLNLATLAAGALTVLPALIDASPIRPWSQFANINARQAAPLNNSQPWNWASGDRKMHGVALGNWLLLERWMDEQWFIDSSGNADARDEWTWSQSLGSRAQSVLEEHWNTWITEADIQLIAEAGFNHIRIPVGYWAFINEPAGTPYVSMGGQVEQMTRVIDLAAQNGLYVVIDLHGLPGSQNGEQPSGRIGYNNFYQEQNIAYGEQAVDAVIEYITNSTHRNIISAFAPMNEPIYYSEEQFDALYGYYERTYAKLSTLDPPIPMMFAPGKPETSPFALWQSFINGKRPDLLVYEDHPYVGRLAPLQSQGSYISQICQKARQYANYDVPVAITEWSLSTAITDDEEWNQRFFAANARAWAQSAGGIFWSYRVNAYPAIQDPSENFTLYSFYHLYTSGQIPRPDAGETSTEYVLGLTDECNFGNSTDTYDPVVSSVRPTVTNAFTRRSLPIETAAPQM